MDFDNTSGYGSARQAEIYLSALTGTRPEYPLAIHTLEMEALGILRPEAYDYVAGGAGAESTMRANEEAFYRWRIVPRMLSDISARDLSIELLGRKLPAPILL